MLHLIVNPTAGKGRAAKEWSRAEALLLQAKLGFCAHHTQVAGDATRLVQTLPPHETVVAVGGDGTLHEVVTGVLQSTPRPVGVLPLGTGDDFARGLGLPVRDLEGAIRVLAAGVTRQIDVGTLNGAAFINGVGTGFDAEVADHIDATPAAWPGPARYLLAILKTLGGLRLRHARVTLDGAVLHDGPALLIAAMNFSMYGGGLRIAPNAQGDDGLLEVVVARKFGRAGALGVLPKLMQGTHIHHPEVLVRRATHALIEWETPTPLHSDGERLPATTRLEVGVRPKALTVLVTK